MISEFSSYTIRVFFWRVNDTAELAVGARAVAGVLTSWPVLICAVWNHQLS
jgi:hypothetical protein